MLLAVRLLALSILLSSPLVPAQQPTTAAEAPNRDTSYIDQQGTAHITRVIPVPRDLSPQAQKFLSAQEPDAGPPQSLAERRQHMEVWGVRSREEWSRLCPNTVEETTLRGVPVRIVTPAHVTAANRDKVLMNLHGGGFNADSGSYAESIPIAGYTGIRVVAVLYRLAPEHPFPASVDDAVAVYRELLKKYKPDHIVIYGTSAGATVTAETAVKLKQLSLPMPAALGIFSTVSDFTDMGDSHAMYTEQGLAGPLAPPSGGAHDPYYIGTTNPRDPVLSPIYADLHGMPPTLFVSSERDMLLSSTANLERAYLRAGDDANLVVFDGLPHAFWYQAQLPEAIEANRLMAKFFLEHLAK
jgi:monoterpene epsilon-lactone hydrolase